MHFSLPILTLAAVTALPSVLHAEDMPGVAVAAQPGNLVCHFDQKCVLGEPCESLNQTGSVSVTEGSLFGQTSVLKVGDERILLQPLLFESGDWIAAEFVTFMGIPSPSIETGVASFLTRTGSGDTVYTVHNSEAPRAVSWHGVCNEAAS